MPQQFILSFFSGWGEGGAVRRTSNGKKQIPRGNDRKKSKSKGKNAGISPLRRQKAPPPVEMTDGW
jgi:hypothetical protein